MGKTLSNYTYIDEKEIVGELLEKIKWENETSKRVEIRAKDYVQKVRYSKRKLGELESFFQQYGLNSEEGLALMTLAEALLRIPDSHTANALIKDKMVAADWLSQQGQSKDLLVKAAGFGLSITKKTLDSAISRVGEPVIRKAMIEAMRLLGKQFVLGRTIEEGIKNSQSYIKKGYRLSYDMLGEGARTEADALKYLDIYEHAIKQVGKSNDLKLPGVSVKLSALHPRYHFNHKDTCVPEMSEKLYLLACTAKDNNVSLTVDAEEVDRLDMSLEIFESVLKKLSNDEWDGFGLAVQAYQKRGMALTEHVLELAKKYKLKLQVRLVKGAYWDTEIKRAQVMGLSDYPVFTRKVNTDLSFISIANLLLDNRDYLYPMIATHNAHTIAAIMELAGNDLTGFEFQRLHGMGETLHDLVLKESSTNTCVYAPCGSHEDLLPYLVRRLLENGANSSFVNKLLDENTPVEEIVSDPIQDAVSHETKRHPQIVLPKGIYSGRLNSSGIDFTQGDEIYPVLAEIKKISESQIFESYPIINGLARKEGDPENIMSPSNKTLLVGKAWLANESLISEAFNKAEKGFNQWSSLSADFRADVLDKLADLLERDQHILLSLCVREAGKTIEDSINELREAVDFCRYYAMQGREKFSEEGVLLPGPTGEKNVLTLHGRGVFVCISPWNFPLAIFTGQITAALMAGNAVIAKPAEQTPLIAAHVIKLMHEAGVLPEALCLLTGDGDIGKHIVNHKSVAGVAFTGSTEVAKLINLALAQKEGPIVPLIAETGGQNAMIVDSSALSEQVIDDVIVSAFGSAGQRCSALRVLYLQEEIADRVLTMLKGAMKLLNVADPIDLSTDVGPVIDKHALNILEEHKKEVIKHGSLLFETVVSDETLEAGYYCRPAAYEIKSIKSLEKEVFGPILHIVRFKAEDIGSVLDEINSTGYGLTCGVHSRISSAMDRVTNNLNVGNAYVNRTTIGAVVGVQPFGGFGLSGTGPKAGGPHYLHRFATEKVICVDTTRQGGNASLVSLTES
jgi:RHH-type proline utilization regulon transcriptional repressor/proline dehydrogenase/delta 1-pyrroline-5-carboxylate dehydrogenase